MTVKFNNGNGAFLCDKCRRIVYTNATVPKELKQLTPEQLEKTPLVCKDCQ